MAENRSHNTSQQRPATAAGVTPAWCGAFVTLLGEQRRLIDALNELSQRQRPLIHPDDTGPLMELVDQRQEVIARIEAQMARLAPMQTHWLDARCSLAQDVVTDVDARIEAIAAIARGIAARDAEDQLLLSERRRSIAAELTQMHGGQRAMNAYAGEGRGGAGIGAVAAFQDREA